MRNILILGAGRSASSLIHYLITHADQQEWRVTVADRELANAQALVHDGHEVAEALALDATDPAARAALIARHDLVISMLPSNMHGDVARDCVEAGKHMFTASYVSGEMKLLEG